ncbi:MAG: hypothetical protein KJ915_01590 [Candidatus Omnitrophica bacterium]|nr:hypothetical protein [Candidatus Omnitrophota bacterium]
MKVCKTCYSEIHDDAKKCPHCHACQTKLSVHNPLFGVFCLLILYVLGAVIYSTMFGKMFDKGEAFTDYKDCLSITESEFKFGERSCTDHNHKTIVVLGKLKNNSPVTWNDVSFEVKFFNKENKLIDGNQAGQYRLVAPANDEVIIKVSMDREFPQEEYVTHKIRIVSAKDESARF